MSRRLVARVERRVALVRVRHDRHHLLTRLRVMAVLGATVAVALAIDGGGRAGDALAGGGTEPPGATGPRPAALMPGAAPGIEGASTWFCAAGTAGDGSMADHTVLMFNAGETDAEAVLTVVPGVLTGDVGATSEATDAEETTTSTTTAGGEGESQGESQGEVESQVESQGEGGGDRPEPVVEEVEVPAGARVDVRLSDHVEAQMVAALVEVHGGEVVVEHRVKGEHGGDTGPCATTTASTWHLAWGTTARDARDIVVVFNPYPTDVTVDAVFTNEEGRRAPVRFQGLPVPAGGVVGIDVGLDVTRSDQVAATFQAHGGRVVVERLQELDGSLGARGLSLALAAPEAARTWVLADGGANAPATTTEAGDAVATTERLVVYNPGSERAEAQVQLVPGADEEVPPPPAFGLSISAGGYQVVDVGSEDRLPAGVAHATVVRSTNGRPVVVERVTADHPPASADGSSGTGSGTTATSGSPLAADRWAFATVADPTAGATSEFVVFNPDPHEAVDVRVVLRRQTSSGGDDDTEDDDTGVAAEDPLDPVSVPPGGRAVIEVDAERAAAARAALVDAGGPVVVERVVRLSDGRRRSMRPGLPLASAAVVLDDLAAAGRLGGIPPS